MLAINLVLEELLLWSSEWRSALSESTTPSWPCRDWFWQGTHGTWAASSWQDTNFEDERPMVEMDPLRVPTTGWPSLINLANGARQEQTIREINVQSQNQCLLAYMLISLHWQKRPECLQEKGGTNILWALDEENPWLQYDINYWLMMEQCW
jgi:hypothetical protein